MNETIATDQTMHNLQYTSEYVDPEALIDMAEMDEVKMFAPAGQVKEQDRQRYERS